METPASESFWVGVDLMPSLHVEGFWGVAGGPRGPPATWDGVQRAAAMDSSAAWATASAVMPNSRYRVW